MNNNLNINNITNDFFVNPNYNNFGFGGNPSVLKDICERGPKRLDRTDIDRIITIASKIRDKIEAFFKILLVIFEKTVGKNSFDTNHLDLDIRQMQGEKGLPNVGDWTKENHVLMTKSSKETNDWKLDFIKKAEQSIEISGSICGGRVFREGLTAIENRLKECPTLKVHLLSTPDLLEPEDLTLLDKIQKKYLHRFKCVISHKKLSSELYQIENHVKLMIVDEKYYIIGGTNYQDRLSAEAAEQPLTDKPLLDHLIGSGAYDMDMVGFGEDLAAIFRREFFKLYALLESGEKSNRPLTNHYFPIDTEHPIATIEALEEHSELVRQVEVKAITGCSKMDGCTAAYAQLIDEVESTMTIAQMYFHPQPLIQEKMENILKEEKIEIEVLTPGLDKDSPIANFFYGFANQNYYTHLKRKKKDKAKIFLNSKNNNIFHKKVGVFDRKQTAIGSYNFGGKSHRDFEMIAVIKSDQVAQKTLAILNKDKENCTELTHEQASAHKKSVKQIVGSAQGCIYPILIG